MYYFIVKDIVMQKDRLGNIVASDCEQEKTLSFLYSNAIGRVLLKLLCRRFVSNIVRVYMNSRFSKPRINKLIKHHNIDMTQYESREFSSFNDFFTRRLAEGARPICESEGALVSPADSKLTVYDIDEDSVYKIKGCDYSIASLLADSELAREYFGGKCFVFRLTVDNYHRYGYPDSGIETSHRFVPGLLHTVNPIATARLDVFGKNCREITMLDTDRFGRVAYIEVGAMMVGRIENRHPEERFERGEEKGYFTFGGSTVILLFKKDVVTPDPDIAENSASDIETIVRYGEQVAELKK